MRITRRTSGGRGEYEISEQAESGVSPKDLFQRRLFLVLADDWIIDTGVQLTNQGGKRRLRLLDGTIQLQRQLAAALLMPHSVRADAPLGRGVPILQADRYAVENIDLSDAGLVGTDSARLHVREIILRNLSHHAEQLGFSQRIQNLEHIWQKRQELPEYLSGLVEQHRAIVRSGSPIPVEAEQIVAQLQLLTTENATDLGLVYRGEGEDVVPDLLETLKAAEIPPAPPIAVAEVDPDRTEIRRRTVKEWKRWAASRGAASARFRQLVRRAWNSTCAVCGLHLPATAFNAVAGVDAAHILPWADYDLDHVSNGVCLCKHHHWAFDEGLIVFKVEGDQYRIEVPTEVSDGIAAESGTFGLSSLVDFVGLIPEARLPKSQNDRPSSQYLQMLLESSS